MSSGATRQEIRPQVGFQEKFLSCGADIIFGGGKAGSGKTFALLLDPLRYVNTVEDFGGVIFRRETPQIVNEGGLWDTSGQIYPNIGGRPRETFHEWQFKRDNTIKFSHLQYESDIYNWQGSQIPYIGFDELTHFSRKMFMYMLSRNRSTCGVRPCIRATCNPEPDSWVREFIDRWIDENGFIIKERDGVIRYFAVDGNNIVWGDTKQEVLDKCPHLFQYMPEDIRKEDLVKSFTFIEGDIYENKKLLTINPEYLANLLAQDPEERAKLLDGNWNIFKDDLALGDAVKIREIFTNFVETSKEKYLTVDVARFGTNLTWMNTWVGFEVVRIDIMTKSKTTDTSKMIEDRRKADQIPASHVIVDQDGVGGGVMDEGDGYIGFSGGGSVLEDPKTKKKENYANLKTQLYYRLFQDVINKNKIKINLDNVWVDGVNTTKVVVGTKVYDVKDLILEDLRAIKRAKTDQDGKKHINSKEEQKNILKGRSPDGGDAIMMRMLPELEAPKDYSWAMGDE